MSGDFESDGRALLAAAGEQEDFRRLFAFEVARGLLQSYLPRRNRIAGMNRRDLLTMLTAGSVADPERLLWIPGKKLISIAKPRPFRHLRSSSQS